MSKKNRDRYEQDDELSAGTALLAAANMLLDAGNIAFIKGDTDTLLEAGDRLLRIGAVLLQVTDPEGESVTSSTSTDTKDDGTTNKARTIGFV
jgi:hypothetical protein